MQRLILITFILTSGLCYGQKDTTKQWTPKDTTEFISVKDMNAKLAEWEDKLSFKDFNSVKAAFEAVITSAIDRKRKKKN
jgi:hypothetical protein